MHDKNTGRPSKLTPEVEVKLLQALLASNTREAAAEYAGVGARTLRRWLQQGRDNPDGPYGGLVAVLKQKESEAVIRNVAIIQEAAKRSWQAAAWWLERRYPREWGSQAREIRDLERRLRELEGDSDDGESWKRGRP